MTFSDDVRLVVREAASLASQAKIAPFGVWLFDVIIFTAADLMMMEPWTMYATAGAILLGLYLQLLITALILSRSPSVGFRWDSRSPTHGRFPSMVLQSVIYSLAVLGGLLLLILPGAIVFARWSVSVPPLLVEKLSALEALRRSWEMTRKALKLTYTIAGMIIVGWIVAVSSFVLAYPDYGAPQWSIAAVVNGIFSTVAIMTWVLETALYVCLRRRELAEHAQPAAPPASPGSAFA